MAKVSVIYRAPKGDSKVIEWGEHTFFDGVATEVEDSDDNIHMISKMKKNPVFELSEIGEVVSRQIAPPFTEMRKGNPAYPRPAEEGDDESEDETAAFEDYAPVKRKPGRPRKVEQHEDEPQGEDAA